MSANVNFVEASVKWSGAYNQCMYVPGTYIVEYLHCVRLPRVPGRFHSHESIHDGPEKLTASLAIYTSAITRLLVGCCQRSGSYHSTVELRLERILRSVWQLFPCPDNVLRRAHTRTHTWMNTKSGQQQTNIAYLQLYTPVEASIILYAAPFSAK